jgi:hypothetical protein
VAYFDPFSRAILRTHRAKLSAEEAHMSTTPTLAELQQQIAALEAELVRLRPIEAAAREAHAFFAGRRPGFAPSYPRDVLKAALAPQASRQSRRQAAPGRRKRR